MNPVLDLVCAIGGVITSICAGFLNVSVMAAYCRMTSKRKSKIANILLLNQSCADFSGLLCSIFWSVCVYFFYRNKFVFPFLIFTYVFSMFTSFNVVSALAVTTLDRYLTAKSASYHQGLTNKRKALLLIPPTWIVSTALAVVYGLLEKDWHSMYNFFMVYFIILITLLLLVVYLLLSTYLDIRRRVFSDCSVVCSLQEVDIQMQKKDERSNRQLIKILFLRICVYVGTILPHLILVLLCLHAFELDLHPSVYDWQSLTDLIFTLYPLLNPLFTIFLRRDFAEARGWLTCVCCSSRGRGSTNEDDGEETVDSTVAGYGLMT